MKRINTIIGAIQKAIEGGWEQQLKEDEWYVHDAGLKGRYVLCIPRHTSGTKTHIDIAAVIFDHDFAKALWGDRLLDRNTGNKMVLKKMPHGVIEVGWTIPAWQYHLQQMVIADDPIKYLGDHL